MTESDPNKSRKPGPEPDRFRIDEPDWKEAAKRAVRKKRPEGGWPKPDEKGDQDENENAPAD